MSILADICAGVQKKTVTDEIDSYTSLTRFFTCINNGTPGNNIPLHTKDYHERLVTFSLKTINVDELDLKALISLRKRENREKDTLLETLRHNYSTKLNNCIKKLNQEAQHQGDREEIIRTFENEMENDLQDLKRELRVETQTSLLSKPVFGAVISLGFSVVEPISTSILSVGLLGKACLDYHEKRRNVLMKHPMAWLYTSNSLNFY